MELTTYLQIAQLAAYVTSIIVFIVLMKADIKIIKHDVRVIQSRADSQSESLKTITATLATVAAQDIRINHIEEDVRELRHGKGFVTGPYTRHGSDN